MAAMHHNEARGGRSTCNRLRMLVASVATLAYGTDAQDEIAAPAFINEIAYERSGA